MYIYICDLSLSLPWMRAFSRMERMRDSSGWMMGRLCGSGRQTTVGTIESHVRRPKHLGGGGGVGGGGG